LMCRLIDCCLSRTIHQRRRGHLKFILYALCGTLTVLLAGCSTVSKSVATVTDYFQGTDNTEPPAELVKFTPTVKIRTLWSHRVGSGFDGQYLKLRPVVVDQRVYAAERKGHVRAFDALDGKSLWETSTEAPLAGGPGVGDGLAVVGSSDGEVIAIEAENGRIRWRVRVSSEVLSQPRITRNIVVVRTVDGKIHGLDAKSGKRVWVYDRTVPLLTLRGTSSPAIAGNTLVAGFDSGRLVALALGNAQVLWEARVSLPKGRSELQRLVDIDADPVIAGDTVYAVTYHGRIAAFDLTSGSVVWRRDMSSNTGLWVDERQVYVTDERSHVWALDRRDSASMWKQSKLEARGVTAPVGFGDYIVVGDAQGYVHWLRREDGQFAARLRVDSSGIIAAPIATDDAVYVYGAGGELAALTVAE